MKIGRGESVHDCHAFTYVRMICQQGTSEFPAVVSYARHGEPFGCVAAIIDFFELSGGFYVSFVLNGGIYAHSIVSRVLVS